MGSSTARACLESVVTTTQAPTRLVVFMACMAETSQFNVITAWFEIDESVKLKVEGVLSKKEDRKTSIDLILKII